MPKTWLLWIGRSIALPPASRAGRTVPLTVQAQAAMADSPGFAYVQPRLQARYAARPSDAEWRLLDASVDVEHYLQAARQTSLKPWMEHLGAETSARDIEAVFREEWAATVREAARLSLIHISEPTRPELVSRMPSSA